MLKKIIPFDQFKIMPWKNGLGTTFEVAIFPLDSSLSNLDFDYRISMAKVSTENQFSKFEGMERYLTVVRGEGIKFNESRLRNLEIIHFDGNNVVHSGPIEPLEENLDLGVIYNPRKINCLMKKIKINSKQEFIIKNKYNYFFKIEKNGPIDCWFLIQDRVDVVEKAELESGTWVCILIDIP